MNLIIPVSYFFGNPRSEIWAINVHKGDKTLLKTLPDSDKQVSGKGITGIAWLNDNQLVACDFNRLFKIDRQGLKITTICEDPELNDLHSLHVDQGLIYVANTGRDSIDIFNYQLELQKRIDCLPSDEWKERNAGNYSISGSYYDSPDGSIPFNCRIVPDKWHFNHVFKTPEHLDGRVIATSFSTRSLLDVNSLKSVSSTFNTQPHDGFVYEDELWVTTVSGQICKAPFKVPYDFEMVVDLFKIAPHKGWCRGLLIASGSIFIGITRIYQTSKRTDWLNCSVEGTRSGVYQLSMNTLEIEAFYDFSSKEGARIFTMIADR